MGESEGRRTPTSAPTLPRFGARLLVLLLAWGGGAVAGELSGYIELTSSETDRELEETGSAPRQDAFDSFRQRYSLNWDGRLYPHLRVNLGGLFEKTDVTQDSRGQIFDSDFIRQRPFIDLRLSTPVFLAQVNFTRNDERLSQAGFDSLRTIRDSFSTTVAWSPEELPTVRLNYFRTDTRDEDREVLDRSEDLFQLFADYLYSEKLNLSYRGSFGTTDEAVAGTTLELQTHTGRVFWSDQFWRGRFQIYSDYNVVWRRTDTQAQGSGEVGFPVFPFLGISSLDDTPRNDPLLPNPALIDGNKVASAGPNIGLPPPGGDDRPRNLGLDLGEPTELNALWVWVDRELDLPIAQSFSWDIYTSPDNDRWTLRQSLASAPFGPFQNRFELRFSSLRARYIKAVVRPLSSSAPSATDWPDIFITELEALDYRPADQVESRTERTSHLYNFGTRTRLLERTALYHELTYFLRDATDSPSTWTLSNGLSLSQPLGKIYSAVARVAHEKGLDRGRDRSALIYTASLAAVPLETFRSSLVVSGVDEDIAGFTDDRISVFLYTVTELYRGVDLNVGIGRTYATDPDGIETVSDQINGIATLVPHRALTFNLIYQDRTSVRERFGAPLPDEFTRAKEISAAWAPLPTIYLFGSYRVENRVDLERRTIRNMELSWTPFPYGALRAALRYNERYLSDLDERIRNVVPSLRWEITRRWFFEAAYQRQTIDSPLRRLTSDILSFTTRFAF